MLSSSSLFVLAAFASVASGADMYVESYWESWVLKDWPDDFAARLEDVPATPVGSSEGVNYVNIAFGDYSGGFAGTEASEDVIIAGIEAIHDKGAKAKLAFGGALYSMGIHITNENEAEDFAQSIKLLKDLYGLDGVDLDVEDGAAGSDIQLMVMERLRNACGEDFHISYTFACLAEASEPWKTVLTEGHPYVDAVNVMAYDAYWDGYSFDLDIAYLDSYGVPRSKIVWGLMPGHHDAANEYTSLEDAVNATVYAKEFGLAGVMTWDINRDTDACKGYAPGEDNLYQTGMPDMTYLDCLSKCVNWDDDEDDCTC